MTDANDTTELAKFSTFFKDIDLNYFEATALITDHMSKGSTRVDNGQILTHCGMSIAYFNNQFITDFAILDSKPWRHVDKFFADKSLDFQLLLPEAKAREVETDILANGFTLDGKMPAMVFDPSESQLKPPPIYDQLRIEQVASDRHLADFRRVAGPAFGMPDFVADRIVSADYAFSDKQAVYIGYLDDEPVSTSLLYISHGIAGIYWITTADGYRGKGCGESLTYHVTKLGLEAGNSIASLQASEMGEPVYKRMGYQTIYYYCKYVKTLSG